MSGSYAVNGTLTVSSSEPFTSSQPIFVGSASGTDGTIEISSYGTLEYTGATPPDVGNYYALALGWNNGEISADAGSGTLNVEGLGALLTTNGNGIAVGPYGNGTLNISSAGTVVSGSPNSEIVAALSVGRQGNGSVSLSDALTQLTANGVVYIGRAGTGSLLIQSQASMFVGVDGTGYGAITIGGNFLDPLNDTAWTGGSGTALVTSNGYLFSQQDIDVGAAGDHGTLTVTDGGLVVTDQQLLIGVSQTEPAGATDITAAGTAELFVPTTFVGYGTVTVSAGGELQAATGMTIGDSGEGGLNVLNGGGVTATAGGINIGATSGAVGSIDVDGVGSALVANGPLRVGEAGQGILDVQNDGSVHIIGNNLDLGGNGSSPGGGEGTVSVTDGGDIEADGGMFIWSRSTILVDASSGVDIGTSGSFVAGAISIESGHTLLGAGVIDSAVVNNGVIDVSNNSTLDDSSSSGGTLEIAGPVSGNGTLVLASGSTLKLDSALSGNPNTVAFTSGEPETLILGSPGSTFDNPIQNLADGDGIELGGSIQILSASFTSPNEITLHTNDGSYVLSDVTLAADSVATLITGTDAATGDSFFQVATRTLTWSGLGTDNVFSDAANWQDASTDAPASTPPSSGDTAIFSSFGSSSGTIAGTGAVASLQFVNGPWTLTAGTNLADSAGVTVGSTTAGTLVVAAGANIASTGTADLIGGYGGSGFVAVDGTGATWTSTNDLTIAGTGSTGTLTATAGGLVVAGDGISVGTLGQGLLQALNGGTIDIAGGAIVVGQSVDSSGTIAISGADALLSFGAAAEGITVGSAGQGSLYVESGGTIEVNGTGGIDIGTSADATGSFVVSGIASAVILGTTALGIDVGDAGQGALDVLNGGTVSLLSSGHGIGVGVTAGSTGTLVVSGSDALLTLGTATTGISVGYAGQGTLDVSDSGTVSLLSSGYGVGVGVSAGSSGTLVISGSDALLALGTNTSGIAVGDSGQGLLEVESNSALLLDGGGLGIGGNTSGTGSVTVAGPGALLVDADGLGVGGSGQGTLNVSNGGTVQVTGGGIGVGYADGGAGSVVVSGTASVITLGTATTGIGVGVAGQGSFQILNGGTVSVQSTGYGVGVGEDVGSSGTLLISGVGAMLLLGTAAGGITVGSAGAGLLEVDDGGTIVVGTTRYAGIYVGSNVGATGSIAVSGEGSELSASSLTFNSGATGGMSVSDGGGVTISNGVFIAQGYLLSVDSASSFEIGTLEDATVGALTVDSGASLTGSGTVAAQVVNDGGIYSYGAASSQTLEITGSISGTGFLEINNETSLKLDQTVASTQIIYFNGAAGSAGDAGTLVLGVPGAGFSNAIYGIGDGDRIELAGVSITAANVLSPGTIAIAEAGGSTYLLTDVNFVADSIQQFLVGVDASTGDSYIQVSCFAAGTRIRTTRGEVKVEDLRQDDLAITGIDGSEAPVVWIGHREVDCARHPQPKSVWPVRIRAGAFGRGLPKRALTLSPDHAVYVNEVLVPVKHLINGTTIAQVKVDRVTYYHVELDRHDVLYADGLPAESYLDVGDRANFANGGPVVRLHIDLAHHWEAGGCAPLVIYGPELEGVKAVVAALEDVLGNRMPRARARREVRRPGRGSPKGAHESTGTTRSAA
jgi:T5SS/PEP-CTERM-associated repeat protein